MVSETDDIQHFLTHHTVFSHLPAPQIEFMAHNSFTEFAKAGDTLRLDDPQTSPRIIVLRSGGLDIRDEHNGLIDRISAGEFLVPEAVNSAASQHRVAALEDTLYYAMDEETFQSLIDNSVEFARLHRSYTRLFHQKSLLDLHAPDEAPPPQSTYLDQFVEDP